MDHDKVIGKLEEQGRHLENRLNRIEAKLDQLLPGYWKMYGMVILLASLSALFVELIRA